MSPAVPDAHLRVADHRLDRADGARLDVRAGFREHRFERGNLRAVAGDGAGAMRLDQPDRGRREIRHAVGAAQRHRLPFRARRRQALVAPVARSADALDARRRCASPSRIASAGAAQHDERDPLADRDPVRGGIEGAALAAWRQRLGLREGDEVERVLEGVAAADDDHVAGPRLELLHREANRRERRTAGRVDREVDATEIETVGDAPGNDVEQHAGKRIFRPFRERVEDFGRRAVDERRQRRAHGVTLPERARAAADAEDDGRAAAQFGIGDVAIREARVDQRGAHDVERQQLQRLDRFQRRRRDPVAQRIEGDVVDEAAPLRVDLVLRGLVGIEIEAPVPTVGRHFPDGVHLVEDVLPEGLHIGCLRQDAAHADDRDLRRLGRQHRDAAARVEFTNLRQQLGAGIGDFLVQLADRGDAVAHQRDLADHIEAAGPLRVGVEFQEGAGARLLAVGGIAVGALGGDPQPADVERLERVAHVVVALAAAQQPPLLGGEGGDEVGVDAADRVAGTGLQQDGAAAFRDLLLKGFNDRPAFDRLMGHRIGGADEHADLAAEPGERPRRGGDHRTRHRVVDAAREQDVDVGRPCPVDVREQDVDHLAPQREARTRPDMAAAFASLEDEPLGAGLEEQAQQPGRRHVQIGRYPGLFEAERLFRPPTREQREIRPERMHDRELLGLQVRRHEAEDADAPGAIGQHRAGFLEQRLDVAAAHQRQRKERQRAALGDLERKFGAVADPRHRALDDRELRPVRPRERRPGRQRRRRLGVGDVFFDRTEQRVHDARHGFEDTCEVACKGGVLTEQPDRIVGIERRDRPAHAIAPFRVRAGRFILAPELPGDLVDGVERRRRGAGEQPVGGAEFVPETLRLAAVHAGDRFLQGVGNARFPR